MKFSFAFSLLALLIPLAVEAAVVPEAELVTRHPQFGRQRGSGGFGGNRGGNKAQQGGGRNNGNNGNKGGASSTTSSAAAATSSAATGQVIAGGGNEKDAQTSLQLDPSVVMKGLEQDGQETPAAGQVPSLTSSNNFINFCLTQNNLPLTNGQQVTTGSCNQTPMGVIVGTDKMPSSKFQFPKNGDIVAPNQAFTIKMAINNLQTGNFVNAQANYYAAPAQTNGDGVLIGHSHVVVEQLDALDQTTPTDPRKFAFFKGLNEAAQGGVLTADVADGLPAGVYRLSSINAAANHQPALVAVAQHGSLDDQIYFTVSDNAGQNGNGNGQNSTGNGQDGNGQNQNGNGDASASASATASSSAASSTSTNATGQGQGRGQNQNQNGNNGQGRGRFGQGQQGKNGRGRNSRGRRDVFAQSS